MSSPAWTAAACRTMGLTTADLSEIGGVSERHAHRWRRGHPLPVDVFEALSAIYNDIETAADLITKSIGTGAEEIECFKSNADLRQKNAMPARGFALGGFAGPWLVACFRALQNADKGNTVLSFVDPDDSLRCTRHSGTESSWKLYPPEQ